jgi:hypothetical protein
VGSPRILVVSSPRGLARAIPNVFAALAAGGAELTFAEEAPAGVEAGSVDLPLDHTRSESGAVALLRRVSDLVRFLGPEFADVYWPRRRTALRALVAAGHPDAEALAARADDWRLPPEVHARVSSMLAELEHRLPPDEALTRALSEAAVDAVLLVSRCSLGGAERDVLKVTRALGLPSVLLVWSWDNLSSKALLVEHPDHVLVWNDTQVDEAQRLHGIARDRVHALGAPGFDPFFAEVEALGPKKDDGRATIVYLGSSTNISRHEPEAFGLWLEAVRAAPDPAVRDARVVVRPYPGTGAWKRWHPPDDERLTVDRGKKLEAHGLAAALRQADVVVALNTIGELEAAIAGRPVVTFRGGELAPGQEGSVHFEYLLEERGGFVVDSLDLAEHVANLARVLDGGYDQARLRMFVERFVRPCGLERPVAPIVAQRILELAGRSSHAA